MNFNLREPSPGDRISANLIREIIRAIRALTPIAGHGVKLSRGPNGTVINANTTGKAKVSPSVRVPGRYEMSVTVNEPEAEDEEKTANLTFSNEYYRCGGVTYAGGPEGQGYGSELNDVPLPTVIALKIDITGSVPTGGPVACEDMADLHEEEADENYYVSPLYILDADGAVTCDFRLGPDAVMWEFGANQQSEV